MAKALLGHVGIGPDLRLMAEVHRLQTRVAHLEEELSRLRAANATLLSSITVDDVYIPIPSDEPALTT